VKVGVGRHARYDRNFVGVEDLGFSFCSLEESEEELTFMCIVGTRAPIGYNGRV
jgi:hypothetical protein